MAHFYIYGDESGKLAQSDLTSFCGYVGHASECERVMMEWNNCRFGWGVPPLHMRCVMYPERDKTGEWPAIKADWGPLWEKKRDAMLRDFGAILRDSHLAAAGCVVDAAHFRLMPDSEWKRETRDPVFIGFHTLLMESLDKIDRISTALSVSIIVDDDEQYAMECYKLLNQLRALFPRVRDRISAITFGNDREYPALQMADMIAYESRALMVEQMASTDALPSDLYTALTKRGIHQPKFWTAEFLEKSAVMSK